ncbi:MAG TPA: hypothetical protein PLV92_20555, partial [Pirellulaceae bacterium]|nr:hypothetical protein [Pirellulaceae bacterium]
MTAVRWGQLLSGCLLLAMAGCAAASSATAPPAAPAPAAPPPTSAQAGATTVVAVAPPAQPCCPKPTIPERLGLKGLGKGLGGIGKQLLSRLTTALDLQGRFPALQPQPPLLPITHPSNSAETAPPVVKAAAEAKAEEDQAPQKVQAIRYLARLGCGGCYHNIEDALLQALDDCTEKVRYEAVTALRGKASQPCVYCKSSKCCSPKVRKKLDEIANKRDKEGCHVEPSARVRRMARMALEGCGGLVESSSAEDRPKEGPEASSVNANARHDHSDLDVEPESVLHDFRWASFTKPASNRPSSDVVVARVNGAAIYDSQVSDLVDSKMDKLRLIGVQLDPTALQQVMHEEVERAIDVRLLMQQLRRERAGDDEPTGEEVAEWLAEKLEVDDNVSLLELSRYYESQQNRLQTQPRVRWERITANVRHFRNRDEAFKVMLYLRGRA